MEDKMKNNIFYSLFFMLAIMLTLGVSNTFAGDVNLEVRDSNNDLLSGVNVYYNDYGNHYVLLGTTDDGTSYNPVVATLPDGNYKFKAVLNHTEQIMDNEPVPGTVNFQTSEFVVHVKKSDDTNFSGIAVAFNDYGNHYLSMGTTDGSGNASIELFPGSRKFRATKDHTDVTGETSNTIEFQTSEFIVHVKKSDNSDFSGIAVAFNDYGNHYLSMGTTDGFGNASIELFPGTRTFRATKDKTYDTSDLTVNTSGGTGTIDFQTSLAIGLVKDCDNSSPIVGIQVQFNDYGNHWLNFGPSDVDGKAYIELFEGNYDFRAMTNHTTQEKPISLSGTSTMVEFNPTKLCFTYSGTVKYNDYGNHWMTITCGTYLFPGTYDFKFDGILQEDLNVSGCLMDGSVLIITLKNSSGAGVPGGKAYLGVGGWPYIGDTDANGNLVYVHSSALTNMSIRMTAPNQGGTQTSPIQDVTVNSHFNFQTSEIQIWLLNSTGALTDGGIVSINDGGWPVIGTTGDDGTGVVKHEHFLPYTRTFRMSYNYGTEAKSQDIGNDPVVIFQTGLVKLWFSGTIQHGVGGWPSYVNPTEMLPIEHRFGFSGSGNPRTELKFTPTAGGILEKTIAYIRVKNSNGSGQPDYTAEWHKYGGPTSAVIGTPDGNGVLLNAMDGHNTTNTNHTVNYLGATLGIWQNPSANSFYIFQLYAVTVELQDNTGAVITTATPDVYFHYYGAGELLFGTMSAGTVAKDLLPGGNTYFFNIKSYSFNGTQGGISGHVDTNPKVFAFQTGKVVDGGFGCTVYWQYGGSQTSFIDGIQLLPGNFYFKNGSGTTKNLSVVAGNTLDINTGTLSKESNTGSETTTFIVPEEFKLYTNYPNPFNPSTTIRFTVKDAKPTILKVYNTLGQEIATLFNGTAEPGKFYQFEFNASNLGSGMYIYRLISGDNVNVKQMMLMK
jgi:Secretion system C-terminal sorting domain